jgi:hypothetical protein
MTLAEWHATWPASAPQGSAVDGGSLRGTLRRYVELEIGAKLLRDVRRTDVQRVIDRMPHHADGEITVGTIKHCYRAMRTALKAGDLRVDPTKSIELPDSMEPGRDWPSADEVARILTGGSRHHLAPGDRVPRLQRVSSGEAIGLRGGRST